MQHHSASELTKLRMRGQRPIGPVVICDNRWSAQKFADKGLFAIEWSDKLDASAIAGLNVVLYQRSAEDYAERAEKIAKANPRQLDVIVKGRAKDGSADLRVGWHG